MYLLHITLHLQKSQQSRNDVDDYEDDTEEELVDYAQGAEPTEGVIAVKGQYPHYFKQHVCYSFMCNYLKSN